MSKTIFLMGYYRDGGAPEVEFFPEYRALEAVNLASKWAGAGMTVVCYEVPQFDKEQSDGT